MGWEGKGRKGSRPETSRLAAGPPDVGAVAPDGLGGFDVPLVEGDEADEDREEEEEVLHSDPKEARTWSPNRRADSPSARSLVSTASIRFRGGRLLPASQLWMVRVGTP